MVNLSEVSLTAMMTLTYRAVEAGKKNPTFNDPMAILCLERLMSVLPEEEKKRINKWKKRYAGMHASNARAGVQRAKNFDNITNQFILNNPGCDVINLACGFDTRFWRIKNEKCRYLELDLPGIIELKKEILKDHLSYELIDCSVLDAAWIDQVTSNGSSNFMLLAEGLFMYLPKQEAIAILQEIARRFHRSQLVLDMALEKYTKGIWKRLLQLESRAWGLDVSMVFGINHPRDIESYGSGFKVIGEAKGSVGPVITISINDA